MGLSFDFKGNIALQLTPAGGGGTPSLSASLFRTISNAPTVNDLKGQGYQSGGSFGVAGISIGSEVLIIDRDPGGAYYGSTTLVGIGAPVPMEIHGEYGNTFNWFEFNLYDSVKNLFSH